VDTSAMASMSGLFGLRLTATDTGTTSFFDYPLQAWTSPFAQWLDQNSVGDENQMLAEASLDADGDGLMNLLEYAVGTNGTVSNVDPQVVTMAPVSSQQYLRLSLPKNPAATDVTFIPEASSDMISWTSAGLVIETNTSTQLIIRDTVPVTSGAKRFMRVRVVRP
jgi:hypothetical protein